MSIYENTLYIMRHGHTNYNELGLCNSSPETNVHLTTQGIAQAQAAAIALRQVPFSRIITSELPRTRQTADIINLYHGLPVHTNARLNDIRSGFEDQPVGNYFKAVGSDRYNTTPPGGESVKQFEQRVIPFLLDFDTANNETILIVTHEETLRVFTRFFLQLSIDEMLNLSFKNCEYRIFRHSSPSD